MNEAKKLFEDNFQQLSLEIKDGNYGQAPFGLDYEESRIWCLAQQSMLQWVLEMM